MSKVKEIVNPYNSRNPAWKHFGLGVLVGQGKIKREKIGFMGEGSPAIAAFNEGLDAVVAVK